MPHTRRQFIVGTLAGVISSMFFEAGAVAAVRPWAAGALQPLVDEPQRSGEKLTLENVHASHFKSCLKTTFQVTGESGACIPLELVEVSELYASPEMENFSVVFQGPPQPVLAQKIYPIAHAQLGELSLFIVPIGLTGQGVRYEAIFNRLIG